MAMAKRGRLGAPRNGPQAEGSSGAPWLVVVLLVGLVGGLGGFLVSQSGNSNGAAPKAPGGAEGESCWFCKEAGRRKCPTCGGGGQGAGRQVEGHPGGGSRWTSSCEGCGGQGSTICGMCKGSGRLPEALVKRLGGAPKK